MTLMAWLRHVRGATSAHMGPSPEWRLTSPDYDAYWRDRGLSEPTAPPPDDPWDYPRFRAMASLMSQEDRVADIGCGSGSFLAFLRDRGFEDVIGVDSSVAAVESLRRHGYLAHRSALEDLDLESLGPVDVAVLSEVLEHVIAFEALLAKVATHASRVIISHPNIGYWPHRLRMLSGRFPIQWGWHPAEHLRFFTVKDLLEHLDRAGYELLSVQAPVGVPSARLRRWRPNLFADHVVFEICRPGRLHGRALNL